MLNVSPLNLLFVVVNLLILLALMKKFLYQPVLGIIAKRQELLDRRFAAAEASKEEAEQMKQKYESYLSDSKKEQEHILKETKAQAEIEYDKILADADLRAKQMMDDAKRASLAEKENAVKAADEEITRLAVEAASKIVFQSSDANSDSMLYQEFLKKAGEMNEF